MPKDNKINNTKSARLKKLKIIQNIQEVRNLQEVKSFELEAKKIRGFVDEISNELASKFQSYIGRNFLLKHINELKKAYINEFEFEVQNFKKDLKLESSKAQFSFQKDFEFRVQIRDLKNELFVAFLTSIDRKKKDFIEKINRKEDYFFKKNNNKIFVENQIKELQKALGKLQEEVFDKLSKEKNNKGFSFESLEKIKLESTSKFENKLKEVREKVEDFFKKEAQNSKAENKDKVKHFFEDTTELVVNLTFHLLLSGFYKLLIEEEILFNNKVSNLIDSFPFFEKQKTSNHSSLMLGHMLNSRKRKLEEDLANSDSSDLKKEKPSSSSASTSTDRYSSPFFIDNLLKNESSKKRLDLIKNK